MRPGVTLEDITRAADQMLFAGHRPTVEGVRNILGTGSPATVNRHLNDYYLRLKDRLTLPPEIAAAAAELHAKTRVVAQAAVDEHEIECRLLATYTGCYWLAACSAALLSRTKSLPKGSPRKNCDRTGHISPVG